MILGLGSDLVDIRRIQKIINHYGERFVRRIYTHAEREKARGNANPAFSYARRFAAKEACSKALGTGFSGGVAWRDIGVLNLPEGKPIIELTGGASLRLKSIVPQGWSGVVHLSITDDFPMAQAFVIIEALQEK